MRMHMISVPVLLLAVACGAQDAGEQAVGSAAPGTSLALGEADASSSSFRATMTGAIEGEYESGNAFSGVAYGRYNMALGGPSQGGEPRSNIAIHFIRDGEARPAVGTYAMGGDNDDFEAQLEVHMESLREFDFGSGELVITAVAGDVVTGRFSFTAQEQIEDAEYGSARPAVRVQGSFVTRAVDWEQ